MFIQIHNAQTVRLTQTMARSRASTCPTAGTETRFQLKTSHIQVVVVCLASIISQMAGASEGIEALVTPGEYRYSIVKSDPPETAPVLSYDERSNHFVSLGPLTFEEQEHLTDLLVRKPDKGRLIGIHREAPSLQSSNLMRLIQWNSSESGWAGTVTVNSPNAKSVRLHLQIETSGPIELIYFELDENDQTKVLERVQVQPSLFENQAESRHTPVVATDRHWSPSATGSTIGFEVRVPNESARDQISLIVTKLAHRFSHGFSSYSGQSSTFSSQFPDTAFPMDLSACENEFAACNTGSYSEEAANATALLTFENGGTFTCTGTLISDVAPGTQHYFLTAEHCISSDTVAGTVEVDWFFQRAACASATLDSRHTTTRGGADLVDAWGSSDTSDISLINLKTAPPSGAHYAGVNTASSAYSTGSLLKILHHTLGLEKRYASALTQGVSSNDILTLTNQSGLPYRGASGGGWFSGSSLVAVLSGAPDGEIVRCGMNTLAYTVNDIMSELQAYVTTPSAGSTPKVWFRNRDQVSASEKGTLQIKVHADRFVSSALEVKYTIKVLSATDATKNVDFTLPNSVSIPPNQVSTDIPVTIIEDTLSEGLIEGFALDIVDTAHYDLGHRTRTLIAWHEDDKAPTSVTLSLNPTNISENAGETMVTVTATVEGTTRWGDAQVVTISVDGTGFNDVVGFPSISNFNLTLPSAADSGSVQFSITPTNDNIDTRDETITVTGELDAVVVKPAILTLSDDDSTPSAIALSLSPTTVSEGAGATDVTVMATIDGTSRFGTDQTIAISIDNSGASNVVGFGDVADFNLTIAKGASSGTAKFSITPIDDSFDTGNETVTVSGKLAGVTVNSASLTLTDDDTAPSKVALSVSPTTIAENAGATEVTVTASIDGTARWGADQTVAISVDDSGASNVVGFADVADFNLTIAKGASSGTAKFSITPTNDSSDTGNETVTVSGSLTGVTVSSTSLTLTDDDTAPSKIALSLSPTTIAEDAGATDVTVTATIDGTARWGADQTVAISVDDSGTSNVVEFAEVSNFNLTIAKGASSGTAKFSITPTNDSSDTGHETVTVSGSLSGVAVSSASLTLTDDDTAPSKIALSLSPTTVSEGAGATEVTVTATIDGTSRFGTDQTIAISVDDSGASNVVEFAEVSNFNLTIAKGASSGTAKFSITPTNDNFDTSNETVTISGSLTDVDVSSANLTLTDDDTAPSKIALSLSPTTVSEGAGVTDVTVTATIDGTSRFAADQTIAISVDDSGASNVVGFAEISNFNLTIAKGASSDTAKFSITPTNDNFDTRNETVTVSGTLAGVTVSSASLTLTDDDTAPSAIALSLSPTTVSEGVGATDVTVTATIDGTTRFAADQTIAISVDDTGASNVVDFTEVSNFNLTIVKGASSGTAKFSITPTNDNFDTNNETVTVRGKLTGVTVSVATLTLTDDDTAPSTIALSISPTTVSEGAGATDVTVTATIDGTSRFAADQTIAISVDDSGASNVVDFTEISNFILTISKGASSGTAKFSITPTNDNFDTNNETVTVSGTLAGVTVTSASLTLTDDDTAPSAIALSLSPTTVSEGAGATDVTVTATIDGNSRFTADQTIVVSVDDSGATNVVGFAEVSNFNLPISKGAGSGHAKFSITPANDNLDTGNETVTVSGSLASVEVSSANLVLTDNDGAPSAIVLSISPTSISEGAGATEVSVTATIDGTSVFATDQTIAISVDDSGASNVVTFAEVSNFNLTITRGDGSGTAKFSITPTNDNVDTGNETVTVSGKLTGVNVSSANLTLTDNDAALSTIALSLSPTTLSEAADETEVTVTATIAGASRFAADQTMAISVDDSGATNVVGFTEVSSFNLTISKGDSSGTAKFKITPTNDNFDTGNETVTVSGKLTGVTVSSTSLTLTDDDTAPSVIALSLSPNTLSEGAGATEVTVTATIDGASRFATDQTIVISVDDSDSNNVVDFAEVSDFNLTIATGASSGTTKFSITPTNDNFDTSNETVTVSGKLTGVTVSSTSLTLTDDDTAPSDMELSLSPTSVSEGASETEVTVTATIDGDSRFTTDQTVVISVDDSDASNVVAFAEISDFNLTVNKGEGSGTAKFSITPTNDNFDTDNETVTVSGKLGDVAVSSASLVLTDDDGAPSAISLSLSPTALSEDAGATNVSVTATIDGSSRFATDQTIVISVNDSGANNVVGFVEVSNFDLIISRGAVSGTATFNLVPTDDTVVSNDETITVSGTLPGVSISPATLTLTNDDEEVIPLIAINNDAEVSEGTAAGYTLTATPAPTSSVTVNLTIAEPSNTGFVDSDNLGQDTVFMPVRGSVRYFVNTQSDTVDESNGLVTVTVTSGSSYSVDDASSASVSVIDDDATSISIARDGSTTITEDGGTETIRITLGRNLQSGEIVTVPLSISGESITPDDYRLALTAGENLNAGVALLASTPHSSAQPAIVFTGTESVNVQTSTLTLTAVADDDAISSETLNIGFGTGSRSVTSNLDRLSGTGTTGTVAEGSVSIEIIDPLVPPPNNEDHGDTQEQAELVDADSVTGGAIEVEGDVDYFEFTFAERGLIEVSTQGDADTTCSLVGDDGEVLQSSDSESGRCLIETYLEQGTYWVVVTGLTEATTGTYILNISSQYDDVSDDVNMPHKLAINSTFASNLSSASDVDYYVIEIDRNTEGSLLIYSLGITDTEGCFYLDIHETDKESWQCDDDSGQNRNFLLSFEVSEATRFLFRVQSHGDSSGRYVLAAEFHAADDGVNLPLEQSHQITSTAHNWLFRVPAVLTVGAMDVYEVRIPQASHFTVQATSQFDSQVRLIRPSELKDIKVDQSDENEEAVSNIEEELTSGTYYITVRGSTATEEVDYLLQLQLKPLDSVESRIVL